MQEATRQGVKRLRNENRIDHAELGHRIDIARVERFQQSNEIGTVVANDDSKTRQAMDVLGQEIKRRVKEDVKEDVSRALEQILEKLSYFLGSNSRLDHNTQDGQ